MPYDKEFFSNVVDHLDKLETGGDTEGGEEKKMPYRAHSGLENELDVRDIITAMVGKGADLHKDDRDALVSRLGVVLGKPLAHKLVLDVDIFNQRKDIHGKNTDEKLDQYYRLVRGDKDLDSIIGHAKSLGYGVHEGSRSSHEILNQEMSGHTLPTTTATDSDKEKLKSVAAQNIR